MVPHQDTRPLAVLVEDQVIVCMALEGILQDAGYDVLTAHSAEDALRVFSGDRKIDVLLTDIELTGMDGVSLSWRARQNRPDLAIVLTSGRWLESEMAQPPGSRFLAKPFSEWQLLTAIEGAI
jgi:CheY-like chemotaxis protein